MAGGALQACGNGGRNMVAWFGLRAAILQALRGVGAAVADAAADTGHHGMLHGAREEGQDRRAIVFLMATTAIAGKRTGRNVAGCLAGCL